MDANIKTLACLTSGAYILGSLPFSLLIGKLFLRKDIRRYGDHNPGAANVFIAGGIPAGIIATLLDIGKGMPFILIANKIGFGQAEAVLLGLAAILGHDFPPWLGFRGGKGVSTTYGVLIALWQPVCLVPFCSTAILGLLILESHAWIMLLTPLTTLIFMLFAGANTNYSILMASIQFLFIIKYAPSISGLPHMRHTIRKYLPPRKHS
jgi:glycerol-3-phosphate acyltransferase PlsY